MHDSDLVQLFLELVYCPVYKPILLENHSEESKDLYNKKVHKFPLVKYMTFTVEIVEFIREEVLPWI